METTAQLLQRIRDQEDNIVRAIESLDRNKSVLYKQTEILADYPCPQATRVMLKKKRNGFEAKESFGPRSLINIRFLDMTAREAHRAVLTKFSPCPNIIVKRMGQNWVDVLVYVSHDYREVVLGV